MGNKRKERYPSQKDTPSNYTTVQNHSPPSPFSRHPRPGKLKEKKKAEHAISEAGLLFRERRLQEPPKRHRHEVQPGPLRASCNPLGDQPVSRPQFPHLSTTAGQRGRLSPALLLPKPSGPGVPRLEVPREAGGGQPGLMSEARLPGAANGRALRPDGRLCSSGSPEAQKQRRGPCLCRSAALTHPSRPPLNAPAPAS